MKKKLNEDKNKSNIEEAKKDVNTSRNKLENISDDVNHEEENAQLKDDTEPKKHKKIRESNFGVYEEGGIIPSVDDKKEEKEENYDDFV